MEKHSQNLEAPIDPLFVPFKIKSHLFKNRLVMGSMHTGLEESWDGFKQLSKYFEQRAKGGAGLIVTGGFAPNFRGALTPFGSTLMFPWQVRKHQRITQSVRRHGSKIFLQILHAGRYAYHPFNVSASSLKASINPFKPRALSSSQIQRTIRHFVRAARLAQKANYDGVEIMGSEGYLINQFLAPRTNLREDEWGGSFENRIRLALEIVKMIRKSCGEDFLICFRISLLDLVEKGSTEEEVLLLAKKLIESGVDLFDSGIGWHESRVPTIAASVPEGAFIETISKFTRQISEGRKERFPVIATNRLHRHALASSVIDQGHASFVSLARPWLADAELGIKWKEHQPEMPCISCNQACLDHIFVNKRASCLVNPLACHEISRALPRFNAALQSHRIAVIGGGVAGLSCAETLLKRGFKVDLFEKDSELGGQFRLASLIPSKERMKEVIQYYEQSIRSLGGNIFINRAFDSQEAKLYRHLIVSSGVKPREPGFEIKHSTVFTYSDWLRADHSGVQNLVILGGGGIAFDIAHQFYHQNSHAKVTMLTRSRGKWGATLGKTTGWILRDSLKSKGIQHVKGVEYLEFKPETGIKVRHNGSEQFYRADAYVLCVGQISDSLLYEELKSLNGSISMIGGAKEASELDAKKSILEGYECARTLML